MNEQNDAPTVPAATPHKAQFTLQRVYTKDISFEAPGAPSAFTQEWNAETSVQFNSGAARVGDKQYEVTLQITVTTTNAGKVAYIAEVRQAGVFFVDGLDTAALELLLGAHCPNILFPYAREIISDLASRGTFPQLLLQPINFDAIYNEAKRRRDQKDAETTAKH